MQIGKSRLPQARPSRHHAKGRAGANWQAGIRARSPHYIKNDGSLRSQPERSVLPRTGTKSKLNRVLRPTAASLPIGKRCTGATLRLGRNRRSGRRARYPTTRSCQLANWQTVANEPQELLLNGALPSSRSIRRSRRTPLWPEPGGLAASRTNRAAEPVQAANWQTGTLASMRRASYKRTTGNPSLHAARSATPKTRSP
jgi:hypothetical protein